MNWFFKPCNGKGRTFQSDAERHDRNDPKKANGTDQSMWES